MKIFALSVAIAVVTIGGVSGAAAQQNQPYCLQSGDGKLDCHLETMAQCQDALKKGPMTAPDEDKAIKVAIKELPESAPPDARLVARRAN